MPSNMVATIERNTFTNVKDLMVSLVNDLTSSGLMTQVFPATSWEGTGTVVLDPTTAIDPLYTPYVDGGTSTSWRMAFTVSGETVKCNIATPIQISSTGTIAVSNLDPVNPGELRRPHLLRYNAVSPILTTSDSISTTPPPSTYTVSPGSIYSSFFIDRTLIGSGLNSAAFPMSYMISASDHGIFIGVWDQSSDEYLVELNNISPAFRWLLVQRSVDNETGDPYITGRSPVYCVYCLYEKDTLVPRLSTEPIYENFDDESNPNVSALAKTKPIILFGVAYKLAMAQAVYKFIVRETDVVRPSLAKPADMNMEDSAAIINTNYQVSVAEDNRYVVTIPKGLNTNRYAYPHELDMLAYTSADVIGQWNDIELNMYNGNTYKYRSLLSNRIKNTGMRILCRVAESTVAPTTTTPAP